MIPDEEQSSAPYLDAVVSYAFRGTARYHVPGHKGGPGADPGVRKAIGPDALAADVPLLIHGIDVGPEPRPYERAERLAAEAYGAAQTWFLTNGATQGNHALCMALAPEGAEVVIQRNAHTSVFDGLVLSGGMPNFVMPEYDAELGLSHCVTATSLEAALSCAQTMRAVMITSPTYYGMTSDVAALAHLAHAAGVPLIVDQSWGPHFGFHEALPPSALTQGADGVLTSTHKTVGSLTQSAMLHLAEGSLIDAAAVSGAMRLLRSTSPSSLLLLSLDGARRQLVLHGEQLLHEALAAVDAARAKLSRVPGVSLVDSALVGSYGVAGHDRLRIVIDVRHTGRSGYQIAAELRTTYDTHVELPSQTTIVLIIGLGETTAALERLAGDVDEVVKRLSRAHPGEPVVVPPPPWSQRLALSPRDAFLSPCDRVNVADAAGRISAESVASYPPGIPALLSGERVSADAVDYLVALAGSGVHLHGASDPEFRTMHVVSDLSSGALSQPRRCD